MNEQNNRSIFELSLDTKVLAERLTEMQPDDVVFYHVLSDLIGRNVHGGTSNLTSARRFVQREYGIVTDVVRGVGIKRLTATGILGTQEPTKKRIRKALSRTVKKIALAKDDDLNREQKQEKYSFIALSGTMQHFLKPAASKAIREGIEDQQTISVGKVLDMVKKAG